TSRNKRWRSSRVPVTHVRTAASSVSIRRSSRSVAVSSQYDVAVVGLGAMGSSALAECAARGRRAIGIERYARGHALGASNGKSRIIRQAYYEHPAYVPLLLRAYGRWRALEARSSITLLELCGL